MLYQYHCACCDKVVASTDKECPYCGSHHIRSHCRLRSWVKLAQHFDAEPEQVAGTDQFDHPESDFRGLHQQGQPQHRRCHMKEDSRPGCHARDNGGYPTLTESSAYGQQIVRSR